MIEHGITTTHASLWAHVCPKARKVYVYLVRDMHEWINAQRPESTNGHSNDGTVTGKGYLVRCGLPFIRSFGIPSKLLNGFPDNGATDREVGMAAEQLVCRMMELGYWPAIMSLRQNGESEQQNGGADFLVTPKEYSLEVKGDIRGGEGEGTGNLFVQTHERAHRVTQIRRADRLDNIPPQTRDSSFFRLAKPEETTA